MLAKASHIWPLTLRGSLILLGSLYLILVLGQQSSDLVANTLGGTALSVLALLLVILVVSFFQLKRNLSVEIFPPGLALHSRSALGFILRTTPIRVPALFKLSFSASWEHSGVDFPENWIYGFERSERVLPLELTFPHRGVWKINHIEAQLTDLFSLCSLRWTVPNSSVSFPLYPTTAQQRVIPVYSSMERSGDALSSQELKSGDLFDIKAYHPSDGMRRIVWKIFAKTGELLSRHPEPAMTPEGTVVVFCLARKVDDSISQLAYQYLLQLEELGLQIQFSCEGATDETGKDPLLAHTAAEALELMNDSVWRADKSDLSSAVSKFVELASASNQGARVRSVVLFIDPNRFLNAAELERCNKLVTSLRDRSISPVFVLDSSDPRISDPFAHRSAPASVETLRQGFRRFLFSSAADSKPNAAYATKFLQNCAQANVEVLR